MWKPFVLAVLLLPYIAYGQYCTSVKHSGALYETDGLWNNVASIYNYSISLDNEWAFNYYNGQYQNDLTKSAFTEWSANSAVYYRIGDVLLSIGNSPYVVGGNPTHVPDGRVGIYLAFSLFNITDTTNMTVSGGAFNTAIGSALSLNQCLTGTSGTITVPGHYYKFDQTLCCTAAGDIIYGASPTPEEVPTTEPAPTVINVVGGSECSSDTFQAWLDIVFVFDISNVMTNIGDLMGSVGTFMENFPVGQVEDHSTRVSIITYGNNATTIYRFADTTDYNGLLDVLLKIDIDSNDEGGNLEDALRMAHDIVESQRSYRVPVIVLSSVAYNPALLRNAVETAATIKKDGTAIMVINFDTSDGVLTTVLKQIASPGYHYLSSQEGLFDSISFGLTQVNCYCPTLTQQFFRNNADSGNITNFADCFRGIPGETNPIIANRVCSPGVLVPLTGSEKETFIEHNLFTSNMQGKKKYTTGLHKASDGQWKWWGYNGTETPYQGYPPFSGTPGPHDDYAYMNNYSGFNWRMETGNNVPLPYICQTRACDATYLCK